MTILIILTAAILLLTVFILINLLRRDDARNGIRNLQAELLRIESSLKNEFVINRLESTEVARTSREELTRSLLAFETKLNVLITTVDQKLREANDSNNVNASTSRNEIKNALVTFKKDFSSSIEIFNGVQKDNFFALLNKQGEQNAATTTALTLMRETIEKKITEMQGSNEKKLDEMRTTVDEKLQKTLETRLGESFKLVSERLEAVHKGLGDMQQLATGVGDLKRVLTNVKTRGVLGEYQLENILEQTLTPDQYAKNVKTKDGSNANVEFAVKLPGKHDAGKIVWLPIDSKFPKEDFELLSAAYDNASPEGIDELRKNFMKGIRKCAGDICGKYIDPPNTTDFAILFLPFESLYAEVLRTPGLFESIRLECKIIITGPTTLSALLSSLQMGFRTLTIEKRSSEVWQLLGAVKTEFSLFGGILEKTKKKLEEASTTLDTASVRTRKIEKSLKNVQELPNASQIALRDDVSAIDASENGI